MKKEKTADEIAAEEYVKSDASWIDDTYQAHEQTFLAGIAHRDAELETHLNLFEESIRHPFKVREDELYSRIDKLDKALKRCKQQKNNAMSEVLSLKDKKNE